MSETPAGRVTDSKKLDAIKSVLSLPEQSGEKTPAHLKNCRVAPSLQPAYDHTACSCQVFMLPEGLGTVEQSHCCHMHCRVQCPLRTGHPPCMSPCSAGEPSEMHTVFQIAGPETPGILAEITQLLSHNGLEIRTAAVRPMAIAALLCGGKVTQTVVHCVQQPAWVSTLHLLATAADTSLSTLL